MQEKVPNSSCDICSPTYIFRGVEPSPVPSWMTNFYVTAVRLLTPTRPPGDAGVTVLAADASPRGELSRLEEFHNAGGVIRSLFANVREIYDWDTHVLLGYFCVPA